MNITKYGHCCMCVEEKGQKILTDPGSFTRDKQEHLTGITAVLYTHEHADHFHLDSLRIILKNNPKAVVIANHGTGRILEEASIPHQVVRDQGEAAVGGVSIKGFGEVHAPIHSSLPAMENTGFYIADRFWYPGDAFPQISVKPEILALPLAGPWMKFSEAVDYAIALKPQIAFAVHDMILHPQFGSFVPTMAAKILEPQGINFLPVELETEYNF